MSKPLRCLTFLFLLTLAVLPTRPLMAQTPVSTAVVDDEYERYKKQGDDFFKTGDYFKARQQYQNCLEVPGFENDVYAKDQINKCAVGLTLNQQAADAVRQGNNPDILRLYNQLLTLNPGDALTKVRLAEYHQQEGNRLFNQKRYLDAKVSYNEALKYADDTKKETLSIQVKTINTILYPLPSRRVGLKLLTGAVAIGAGAYAFLLRNDYQSKMGTLSQISTAVDPNNTGVIDIPDNYRQYSDAYAAAEAAGQKNGLYKACIGVAAFATVAELYLLIHKPKAKSPVSAVQWHPSSQSWGLAVSYTF